jgi:hypothetical protein
MSALAERSGRGEVKPSLFRAVMKTDARALTQGARGKPQLLEPPGADPHAGWCGRGERATAPPIPIVRPAWAHSYGCKSRHKLVTVSEVKRNCMRATDCGEEAWIEAAGR